MIESESSIRPSNFNNYNGIARMRTEGEDMDNGDEGVFEIDEYGNEVSMSTDTEAAGKKLEAPVGTEEEDFFAECKPCTTMPDPGMPTAQQRKTHNQTHMPFRSWCRHCVQGRGRDIYHGRVHDKSRVPRICMDFMFSTERGATQDREEADQATECIAILVLKDEMFESVWAYPMESKSMIKSEWLVD